MSECQKQKPAGTNPAGWTAPSVCCAAPEEAGSSILGVRIIWRTPGTGTGAGEPTGRAPALPAALGTAGSTAILGPDDHLRGQGWTERQGQTDGQTDRLLGWCTVAGES